MTEIQTLSSPNDESYDHDNDNTDGDGVGLSLDIGGDDDNNDEINTTAIDIARQEAGLNSPKGEMQLQLEDETNIATNPSPATAMRNKYNINSPKGDKKKLDWGNKKPDNNSATKSTGGGIESLVTQVDKPGTTTTNELTPKQDDDTNKDLQEFTQQGGFCSCFCNLFNCCSKPSVDTDHPDTPLTQIPKQSTNEKDGTGLLDSGNTTDINKNNTTTKEHSISESSTIYDGNLLPPIPDDKKGKKCLILDLDETLVHSSFKPIPKPDFIIPVEIDHVVHHVYVLKRPYVDKFLEICAKHYEIVIFTASLSKYADPLLDKLDPNQYISHRLFRESCVIHGTAYVKDLRKLGRKLKNSIIVDNSPPSYLFQPDCAVPITSWFDDPTDTQLKDFIPVLETTLKDIPDIRKVLDAHNKSFRWLCNQAGKPLETYGY